MSRRIGIGAVLAAVLFAAAPGVAAAQNPTRFDDPAPDGCAVDGCTLREALAESANDATITLEAGTYELTRGELSLNGFRRLEGADARRTEISALNTSRVISVTTGSPAIIGVTIVDGLTTGSGGGISIASAAGLELRQSTVRGNQALIGGGIASAGDLTVHASTVSGNRAEGAGARGGGVAITDGLATITTSTISGNISTETGGGLFTRADVILQHVTIAENHGEDGGGGAIVQAFDAPGDSTSANGVLVARNGENCIGTEGAAGFITASHSLFDDDTCNVGQETNVFVPDARIGELAPNGGPTNVHPLAPGSPAINAAASGGCSADQRGMTGPQAATCDIGAYEARFLFEVTTEADQNGLCTTEPGDCSLREAVAFAAENSMIDIPAGHYGLELGDIPVLHGVNLYGAGPRLTTIEANDSRAFAFRGGGSTLQRVTITGGSATDVEGLGGAAGGAIWVDDGAALSVYRSTLVDNVARVGGAIAAAGDLFVTHSTIAENRAVGAPPFAGQGGGLAVLEGQAALLNSTVSGNQADTLAGGIASFGSDLHLRHVTIAENTAPVGPALYQDQTIGPDETFVGQAVIYNSLFANHAPDACENDAPIVAEGGGITEDDSCPGAVFSDAGITALGDHGGETDDHDLWPDSPAIGAADPLTCLGVDQRDHARPSPEDCDSGAVEALGSATELRVTTRVDNSGGGQAHHSDFLVHVRLGGDDVAGSPKPGDNHGTPYALDPGTYAVEGIPEAGYTVSYSGACAADGTVVLEEDEQMECIVEFDDPGLFVNTTADNGDGVCTQDPEGCTLREAIAQSPDDAPVMVPAGEYVLGTTLVVNSDVDIQGSGASDTVIRTTDSGVFRLNEGDVVMRGVRITGGSATPARGGGILVRSDSRLTLIESTIAENSAAQGGGIAVEGRLVLDRSTVWDNAAVDDDGGGIFVAEGGVAELANSTVSGNEAPLGGGGVAARGSVDLVHVTFHGNDAGTGDAVAHLGNVTARGTILAGNGEACGRLEPGSSTIAASSSLAADDTCFAAGAGNLVADPLLGALDFHGGLTQTHMPGAGSPVVDAAGTSCVNSDQRSNVRPFGVACDIGSVETDQLVKARLRVAVNVVNDSGGTLASAPVTLRRGGTDVGGAGDHVVDPGTYVVSAAAPGGYTMAIGDGCAADGSITLDAGEDARCVVTFDDIAQQQGGTNQPPAPEDEQELPPPTAGEEVNAEVARGTVKVRLPGTSRFVDLSEARQLPVGTVVDTLKGRVTLEAAGGQTATFYDGIFRIGQGKGARPLTTLTLVEALSCPRAGRAVAAAKKKKRRLWGDGNGRFRTKGKHSAATVVGTKWLVEDRCTSTLTRVTQGRVSVRDFVKKKTVTVRAGKKYVARAR